MSPEVDLHLGIKRNPRRSVKNKTRPFNFSYTLVLGACRRAKMSSLIWTWSKPNICTRSVLLTSFCRLELFYFIFIIFCSILFYYSTLFYSILSYSILHLRICRNNFLCCFREIQDNFFFSHIFNSGI